MNSTLLIGMPGGAEWIFILIIELIALLCLVDIWKSDFRRPAAKLMWCITVIFFPLLGSLLYYWIGTEQKVVRN